MRGGQRVQECIRHKLARDGARGFGFGIGCLGVILMTRDGHRQAGIGRIGVGMVTVVTAVLQAQQAQWQLPAANIS